MKDDPWEEVPELLGVLHGGGTVIGIFSPAFFQMGFLKGNPEKELKDYFDFMEKESSNDLKTY
jgi:hypothetical protein